MKKIISLLILVIFLSNVVAAAIHPVVGTVVESGNGVSDAYVVVNCNSIVKTTYSLSGGVYAVEYNDTECPDESMVYVEATKDSYYGAASGPMHDFTVLTIAIIDVFLFLIDYDFDGVPDNEDECSGTIGNQEVYGCSCEQILELKPGNDKSNKCSKGIIDVFTKRIGWAKDLFGDE